LVKSGVGTAARLRSISTLGVEIVLAVAGLAYTVLSGESAAEDAAFLSLWGLLAVTYLFVGGRRVRRQRQQDAPLLPRRPGRRRFSFFFTVAASLTGLGAATNVLSTEDTEYGNLVTGLGVIVMISAWMLLQVGYARYYSQWTTDLRFPETPEPQLVDYLYFAFTVGVSFAASDVEVCSRKLRWHVMVHSVISFLYNAVVLATAVSIIIGR
jgi:uncharacterized membrane protein